MVFWKVFLQSIQIPRKQSVFKLNRVRMDIAVVYMFILIGLVSIPSLIEQIKINSSSSIHVHTVFFLIFFFMFYYLVLVVSIFVFISVYAYVGVNLARLMKRRLHFSILWKVTAFSTTLPFVIYTFVSLVLPLPNSVLLFFFIYMTIILYKIIAIYPAVDKKS